MEENVTPKTEQNNQGLINNGKISINLKMVLYILGAIFTIIAFFSIMSLDPSDKEDKFVDLITRGFKGIFWMLLGGTLLILGFITSLKEKK